MPTKTIENHWANMKTKEKQQKNQRKPITKKTMITKTLHMNNDLESTIKGKRRKKQWKPQKTNEQPNKDQQKDNERNTD